MDSWVAEELKHADLGDARRHRRLVKIVSDLAAQPNASVPQASGNWAATQGAYDFWVNPRVKASDIREAHHCRNSAAKRTYQLSTIIAHHNQRAPGD